MGGRPTKKSKGKNKGKESGSWVWMPPAQQGQWVKVPAKGKNKAKGNKEKGNKKQRGLFSELSEEKQAKIQEKWAARAEKEGRSQVGGSTFKGTVVWRCKSYGWIVPSNPVTLPQKVKASMASMTAEARSKAEENGGESDRFAQDVLYFRACDRSDMVTKIDKDMEVLFKVYTDSKGAGAMEVEPAA